MRQYIAKAFVLGVTATTIHAVEFNAAEDFSHLDNPDGPWSYGYEDFGGFHLMPLNTQIAKDIFFWQGNQGGPLKEPSAGKNEGDAVLLINQSSNYGTTYAPGTFAMHPGPFGQRAVLRWTAPYSGVFSIAAHFDGLDKMTTTDASVRVNGTILDRDFISGLDTPFDFFTSLSFAANEKADFLVGFGENGRYEFDSTKLDVLISDPPLTDFPDFPERNLAGLKVIHLDFGGGGPPPYVPETGSGGSTTPPHLPEGGSGIMLGLSALASLSVLKNRRAAV